MLSLFGIAFYFYPKQSFPPGININLNIPDVKYNDDCLHPCVRFVENGFIGHKWWMIQSPYFNRNSKIENPILFYSDEKIPLNWKFFKIVKDTPQKGYNSDPNLFFEDNKMWILWRECYTENCDANDSECIVCAKYTSDGIKFSDEIILLKQKSIKSNDNILSPSLLKYKDVYYLFTVDYQFLPQRKNNSIVIWESPNLIETEFKVKCKCASDNILTVDKWKELQVLNTILFIPKPLRHDIWHIDLFEKDNKIFIVSVSEWGDNIMLSELIDFKYIRTNHKPLLNNHALQKTLKRRTYFYKSSFVNNGNKFIFYTTTENNSNKLFMSIQ